MTNSYIDITSALLKSAPTADTTGVVNTGDCATSESFETSIEEVIRANSQEVSSPEMEERLHEIPAFPYATRQELPLLGVLIDDIEEQNLKIDNLTSDALRITPELTQAMSAQLLAADNLHYGIDGMNKVVLSPNTFYLGQEAWSNNSLNLASTLMHQRPPSSLGFDASGEIYNILTEPDGELDHVTRALSDSRAVVTPVIQSSSTPSVQGEPGPISKQAFSGKSTELISVTEFSSHLRVLRSFGAGEVRMQLHPAEMGRMLINLVTEGDDARITFVVENNQARHALESSMPRLRELMEQAGLSLVDVDVAEREFSEPGHNSDGQRKENANDDNGYEDPVSNVSAKASAYIVDTFA